MRSVLLLSASMALSTGAGCSFIFDDEKPAVTLLGSAPNPATFRRLNRAPASSSSLINGVDGSPWVVFNEQDVTMRAVRVDGTPGEEEFDVGNIIPRYTAIYMLDPKDDPVTVPRRKLAIHTLGTSHNTDVKFDFPQGDELISIGGGYDDVFVYWVLDKDTTSFQILHRDQSYARTVPIPKLRPDVVQIDPTNPGAEMSWTGDGKILVIRWTDGSVTGYSTVEDRTVQIAVSGSADLPNGIGPNWFIDDEFRQIFTYGGDGIHTYPIGGDGPARTLEPTPVATDTLFFYSGSVWYRVGDEFRRVLRDGSGPVTLVKKGLSRVYTFFGDLPNVQVIYGLDPAGEYGAGAGDLWLGDWNFMERGRSLGFSQDGKLFRWLEHAADTAGVGELVSATRPLMGQTMGGAPVHLARNVRQFDEVSKGKLLVVENHATFGVQNRLVLIDEATMTSRWVAPAAHEFHYIPGSTDLIVDTVSGATALDIMRVPMPPDPPAM